MIKLYDIKLDQDKNIYLELITLETVSEYDNTTHRNTRYYREVSREIEYPENLKERIAYLRAIGFKSIISVFPRSFNVGNLSVLNNLMINMLEKLHILLDVVYDDKTIRDGLNAVTTYIHYIDPNTGIEYAKPISVRSDITGEEMLEAGYTPIENSVLMQNLNELSNQQFFAIELEKNRSTNLTQN